MGQVHPKTKKFFKKTLSIVRSLLYPVLNIPTQNYFFKFGKSIISSGSTIGDWKTCPPSSQNSKKLSKKNDIKSVGCAFRWKNYCQNLPHLLVLLELAPPLIKLFPVYFRSN